MRLDHAALASALAILAVGCEKDDDDDSNTGSGSSGSSGSSWLVGDDGEMRRLTLDGTSSPYRLDTDADLHAIACFGLTGAWVVGSAGTVLSTADGGTSWQSHDLGVTTDLAAVAVSERGAPRVVIAGDGVLVSQRGDGGFVSLHSGGLEWQAVALDHDGDRLLAAAADGSIWRADGDSLLTSLARFDDQPLASLALAGSADVAVVVGALGFMARTDDGGATWSPVALPTVRDLWAVRIAHDGDAVIAVGEAGVMVRVDESGAVAEELLDPALSLRAVHMHGEGTGQTVGDAGIAMLTTDFGASWDPIALDVETALRGVDDIRVHGHW